MAQRQSDGELLALELLTDNSEGKHVRRFQEGGRYYPLVARGADYCVVRFFDAPLDDKIRPRKTHSV